MQPIIVLYSSLKPPVQHRNLNRVLSWCTKTSRLYDALQPKMDWSLEQQTVKRYPVMQNRQKKFRHKDIIKRNLGVINNPLENWQYQSKHRKNCREKISWMSSSETMDSKYLPTPLRKQDARHSIFKQSLMVFLLLYRLLYSG